MDKAKRWVLCLLLIGLVANKVFAQPAGGGSRLRVKSEADHPLRHKASRINVSSPFDTGVGIGVSPPSGVELYVEGDAGISSNLTVGGTATFSDDLTVSGSIYGSNSVSFYPEGAKFPASNPAGVDASSYQFKLLYDDTTNESVSWSGIMNTYDGQDIWVDIIYAMTSDTSGDVQFKVYMTPQGAGEDIDSGWWESAVEAVGGCPATLGHLETVSANFTASGTSLLTGDWYMLKLERNASADGATGDCEVVGINIRSPR